MKKLALGMAAAFTLTALVGCNPQPNQQSNQDKQDTGKTVAMEPKEIYANNCSSCHGGNLQGSVGPALDKIGSKMDQQQISDIIKNGVNSMPAQSQLSDEDRDQLSAWLAEKK
ncbi:c-type cytochrome [Hazenella coriacea]|uniref:Cytochrome c551 n=1 Tax=Hazenella coriacea TaxID=1179467 RepID=A0A4R3L8X4_9BACL|nr:cytochrome c [Hazenella coriacea]TCS95658.1 cytochrome c551 [Hazenella coriacea]